MDGDGPPSVNDTDANPISAILPYGNTTNKQIACSPAEEQRRDRTDPYGKSNDLHARRTNAW